MSYKVTVKRAGSGARAVDNADQKRVEFAKNFLVHDLEGSTSTDRQAYENSEGNSRFTKSDAEKVLATLRTIAAKFDLKVGSEVVEDGGLYLVTCWKAGTRGRKNLAREGVKLI